MKVADAGFGRAWLGLGSSAETWTAADNETLQGLRMLAILRIFAPAAQVFTLFVATNQFGVLVRLTPILVLLAIEFLVAIATWIRVSKAPSVSQLELFLQAQLDIALLAAMLYLTGGASNPFAPLFVLPMAIAASALAPRLIWIIAISTMAAYALLRYYHVPLHHPSGETEVYELHENGMVINYVFTAALLAFFIIRMRAAFIRHHGMLADARDTQMRNESVVAIAALAAGYAHELSSPLATMAVVVAELKREQHHNPAVRQDLLLLDEQIRACKQIVSNLANAGGARRAESAGEARLDEFLMLIVERARALHPGATITVSVDKRTPPPRIVAEETLRQAIANVIINAAQASPQHVEVSADWSGSDLVVVVCDYGRGIDPAVLHRLGKQAGSTKGPDGGMGLGLILSVATLESLGGRLELVNLRDGGVRAEIRVPLRAISISSKRKDSHGPPSA